MRDKDKCKKCKGNKVVNEKKVMEIFIEKGMRSGEKIPMKGEGDQQPGVETGDVILVLQQKPHAVFERNGADLSCKITIPLVEALCGFSKVLVTHLDGRGIHVEQLAGNVVKPGQVKKIVGEGMPHFKRPIDKGDLYITFQVEFPQDGWVTASALKVSIALVCRVVVSLLQTRYANLASIAFSQCAVLVFGSLASQSWTSLHGSRIGGPLHIDRRQHG